MKRTIIAAALAAATVTATAACGTTETGAPAASSAAPTTPLGAEFNHVDRLHAEAAAQQGLGYVWAEPEAGSCGRIWLRAPDGATVNADATGLSHSSTGARVRVGAMLLWACPAPGQTPPERVPDKVTPNRRDEAEAAKAAAEGEAYVWTTETRSCQDAHVTVSGQTYTLPYAWLIDVRTAPAGGRALHAERDLNSLGFCTAERLR